VARCAGQAVRDSDVADENFTSSCRNHHHLSVRGCNGTGEAESSNNGVGATPSADTTPPSMPTGLTVTAAGSTGANLSWNASTDNVGVTGYIVSRDGIEAGTTATTTYAETRFVPRSDLQLLRGGPRRGRQSLTRFANAKFNLADTTPPLRQPASRPRGRFDRGQPVVERFNRQRRSDRYILLRNGVQVATPPRRVLPTRVCPPQRPTATPWRLATRPATSQPIRKCKRHDRER